MLANPPVAQPDVQATAHALVAALRTVLQALPGAPHSPSPLAQRLGLSRVTISKLMGALERSTPYDTLERMPGPDSLTDFVAAAAKLGVESALVEQAQRAIDEFEALIRDRFGTRAALHAAIGGGSLPLRSRVDQAARAEVFKGLRQILGVEANTWLTSMFFVPSGDDPEAVSVTTIHGPLGMRRLRPDTQVYFTFGPPYPEPGNGADLTQTPISLQEYYTNEPASFDVSMMGGQLRHRLNDDRLGKHAVADMLAVSHTAKGSRRYAAPGSTLRGVSLFVDTPVRMLICDAILHRDVFPDSQPQLLVYNPGARGPANPNDRDRDIDRVAVTETVAFVPATPQRFEVSEVPNYRKMVARVCGLIGRSLDEFCVYRLRMPYPVPSFQVGIAFTAPERPGA